MKTTFSSYILDKPQPCLQLLQEQHILPHQVLVEKNVYFLIIEEKIQKLLFIKSCSPQMRKV